MSNQNTGADMAKSLASFINNMGADKKGFIDTVMREHRTLQQSIFGLFLATVEEWSKQTHCDARNEFTVTTSKRIMDEVLGGMSGVPFI